MAVGVNDRAQLRRVVRTEQTNTTTSVKRNNPAGPESAGLARVEHLGTQAGPARTKSEARTSSENRNFKFELATGESEGNKLATTISTIAAQSGQSRIVVALLRDGRELQLKIQEMRPGLFEVGANLAECAKYLEEHQRLVKNLGRQREGPIEAWLAKYKKINSLQANMSNELRLIYLCMAENLQGCWRGLLGQLELRLELLDETCQFYRRAEQLVAALEQADHHVQTYRREFLDGPGSLRFQQAANELGRLNGRVLEEFVVAKQKQEQLIELVGRIAASNLGDSRTNLLLADGQNLINFLASYIEPLERRKVQLESVIRSSSGKNRSEAASQSANFSSLESRRTRRSSGAGSTLREISNFNDLNLAGDWLNVKVEQLNSSLLSSLGASAQDTRSILNKHEQIALECSAIEEATLNFNGKNIHAIRSAAGANPQQPQQHQAGLFEQQKELAERARDVITILDARLVLLRRTIDFYSRARSATSDIKKMMRRLQVDNSLQSVQFVADELELKDVSSVVASGATVLSELQQLQLAQQHGQRSKIVNLNLMTSGIRSVIDQLNQELAHLKTVLNQRRLVLLNEDASKMAQNFTSKCRQLKFWLDNHAKSHLLANNRLGFEPNSVRAFCEAHEELRQALQQKTLEVEALLRLLSTLTESFDAKSQQADEILRDTDELRQEWIAVTNCLEARIDFARKFLSILANLAATNADLDLLGREPAGENSRPRTPDERSESDVKSAVEQQLVQLANQVKNFTLDAQTSKTALVHAAPLEQKSSAHDLNKHQIVGHANGALKLLSERNKSTLSKLRARGPRKWLDETGAGPPEIRPARFVRQLADQQVEPFSSATLECELDRKCRVEWLLNNKRIPNNVKHSTASEANTHRLTIGQFGPVCCGTYTARATPLGQNGPSTSSSCRLRLSGIREDEGADLREGSAASGELAQQPAGKTPTSGRLASAAQRQQQVAPAQAPSKPKAARWRSNGANGWQQEQLETSKESALERIIQGVESPASFDEQPAGELASGKTTTTSTTRQVVEETTSLGTFPVTQVSYGGNKPNAAREQRQVQMEFIDSPAPRGSSASAQTSRSISRSPFEGTPQPPVFMQGLQEHRAEVAPNCQQAGLVCVVIGNPPPNVEWLHDGKPIASAKCQRPTTNPRANICKLTIETLDDKTEGQYVCRASNRLGQTTSALMLTK